MLLRAEGAAEINLNKTTGAAILSDHIALTCVEFTGQGHSACVLELIVSHAQLAFAILSKRDAQTVMVRSHQTS